MKSIIRAHFVLLLPLLVGACSVKSESRTCVYNGVQVSCDEFDRMHKGSPDDGTHTTTIPEKPTRIAECVRYAVDGPISQSDAERLCSRSIVLGYCVADTVKAPISQVDAERFCKVSPDYADCIVQMIKGPISQIDAERLCRK